MALGPGSSGGRVEGAPGGLSRILPPVWFAAACIVMWIMDGELGAQDVIGPPLTYVGIVIFALGALLAVWAKRHFDRFGTPVVPFKVSTALVDTGPFRRTRNPMYLGMVLGLLGLAVYFGSWPPLLVIPAFVWVITSKFIVHEERVMQKLFGEAYLAYKDRVRRWF